MNLALSAEKDVRPCDGWSWCSNTFWTNICLLEALVGRGHTGTVCINLCSHLKNTHVLVIVIQAVFVIGLGTHTVHIYEVVLGWIFFSWKLCIFIILGSNLACLVFTSALGPTVRLKNYEWFLSLTWLKKGCQVWKMLIFHIMYLVQ